MSKGYQLWVGIAVTILGGLMLSWLYMGAWDRNDYRAGTPATATNVHCDHPEGQPADCTGTWSIDGKSYTGEIRGWSEDASSLDIRVHDGIGYAAGAGREEFEFAAIFAAVLGVLFVAQWCERRRRGRQLADRIDAVGKR